MVEFAVYMTLRIPTQATTGGITDVVESTDYVYRM